MPTDPNKLSQFWQELKRRNVFRVITVYVAVAFMVLEGVDIIFPRMGLPDWNEAWRHLLYPVPYLPSYEPSASGLPAQDFTPLEDTTNPVPGIPTLHTFDLHPLSA